MNLHERCTWLFPFLAAVVCAAGAPAAAQPTLAQADESQTERARVSFQAGKTAFEEGRYDQALEHFTAADAAVASPNAKLMAARSLAQLGRLAEAFRLLTALIREAESWGDGRYARAAQAAAEEQVALKPRIVMLSVEVRDPTGDATLTVAGRELPRSAWVEPIAIDPGAFEVVLTGRAGQRDSHRLTLAPGVAATLELAIEADATTPSPQPAPPPPAPASPPPSARADSAGGTSSLRTWGYVVGAVGVAGIAAFATFGALSNGELAELEQGCPERTACTASLRETADRGSTYQTVANVSLAVGVAALGTGVTLWVLGAPEDSVELTVAPAALRLRGTF
jgi:hypothetical protein